MLFSWILLTLHCLLKIIRMPQTSEKYWFFHRSTYCQVTCKQSLAFQCSDKNLCSYFFYTVCLWMWGCHTWLYLRPHKIFSPYRCEKLQSCFCGDANQEVDHVAPTASHLPLQHPAYNPLLHNLYLQYPSDLSKCVIQVSVYNKNRRYEYYNTERSGVRNDPTASCMTHISSRG